MREFALIFSKPHHTSLTFLKLFHCNSISIVFCISHGLVWKKDDQGFGFLNPLLNIMIENNFFMRRRGGGSSPLLYLWPMTTFLQHIKKEYEDEYFSCD